MVDDEVLPEVPAVAPVEPVVEPVVDDELVSVLLVPEVPVLPVVAPVPVDAVPLLAGAPSD